MRTMMRSLVFCFLMIIVILLSTPQVHAQDLSRYRISFGMTLADLSKQIDQQPANAAVLHERLEHLVDRVALQRQDQVHLAIDDV